MRVSRAIAFLLAATTLFAQGELKQRNGNEPQQPSEEVRVAPGTHVLLSMINSVSTKQAQPGDRMYLETAFPVLVENRIVIPRGSWVTGTITEVKRPGRVKGRGELQVRFDSLTLPNGVTKHFRSDLSAVDGQSNETLEREKSKVKSPDNKGGDTRTVIGASAAGAGIGAIARGAAGAGIGAGAGAAAGLIGVLATRGPDAVLTKGSSVEMVLDRQLTFQQSDLDFGHTVPRSALTGGQPNPASESAEGGLRPHLPF